MIKTGLETLVLELRKFSKDRDWEQFHSPKNLSMALSVEVSELLEHLYLIRLADVLGIDLIEASLHKISLNQEKYPIALSKGSNKKYTDFE